MPSYGEAPYEESSGKAALRLLLSGLSAGAQVRPGANFLQGLGTGAAYGLNQQAASQKAAQDYAMKQMEAEQAREDRDLRRKSIEAQIKQMEKPQKKEIWQMTPEEQAASIKYEADKAKALSAAKPMETKTETGLVQIDSPGGPIYVRPSQAVGKRAPVKPSAGAKPKPSTGEEKKNMGFYVLASDASKVLDQLEPKVSQIAGQLSMRLPNALQPEVAQRYNQAVLTIADANLRMKSGAAVTPKEIENEARAFYVQPGDKLPTIRQKRRALQRIIDTMKFKAGKAYDEYYKGEAAQADTTEEEDPLSQFMVAE